jgi:plastocyanin
MVFKAWQVLLFSLIPMALVFMGVFVGSMHGVDSEAEDFPTPAPRASGGGPGGPAATVPAGTTLIQVTARNLAFIERTLRAPASTQVTVRLNNEDAGVTHNVAFYRSRTATTQPLVDGAVGPLFPGPDVRDFSFTTPGRGNYFYRCDVHPDMNGTFIVN